MYSNWKVFMGNRPYILCLFSDPLEKTYLLVFVPSILTLRQNHKEPQVTN